MPEQNSRSGSQELDENVRKRGDGAVPVIPAEVK
jgi:hypothetical protein